MAPVVSAPAPPTIKTPRLVIRCWDPADAPLLKLAIDTSLEHLQRWMPWARAEPSSLEEKAALLRIFRDDFASGRTFVYGIFTPDESEVVGGAGLHARVGDDAFEIGYWIRASRTGEGLATEATAVLAAVAFTICGVDRVEIHIDPANEASLRIPVKLGFAEEARLRRRLPPYVGETERRDAVIFTLFADEFPRSPAAKAEFEVS
jgi:RimJ/RimL family protein N-acetyltransferase